MKNGQRLCPVGTVIHRIVPEAGKRAGRLLLDLGSRLAFPHAKADFLEALVERQRQVVPFRQRLGKSAATHQRRRDDPCPWHPFADCRIHLRPAFFR